MIAIDERDVTVHIGQAIDGLRTLPTGSVDMICTSPPYWQLRDYDVPGQLGWELTPAEFVAALLDVLGEARRVLADDGVMFLNLGDSYTSKARGSDKGWEHSRLHNPGAVQKRQSASMRKTGERHRGKAAGLVEKNLVGVPWQVAFALQANGWVLRNAIIWRKTNAMPTSATDRLACTYEHVFLLAKQPRYRFFLDRIRRPHKRKWEPGNNGGRAVGGESWDRGDHLNVGMATAAPHKLGANPGDVWDIATEPYPGAHDAVMPSELARRCVLAGCPDGGTVLDPFVGSGTVLQAARALGMRGIGIDLDERNVPLILERLADPTLGFHADPEPSPEPAPEFEDVPMFDLGAA